MITLPQRVTIISLIDTARAAGARLAKACAVLGLSIRTVQRWRRDAARPVHGPYVRACIWQRSLIQTGDATTRAFP